MKNLILSMFLLFAVTLTFENVVEGESPPEIVTIMNDADVQEAAINVEFTESYSVTKQIPAEVLSLSYVYGENAEIANLNYNHVSQENPEHVLAKFNEFNKQLKLPAAPHVENFNSVRPEKPGWQDENLKNTTYKS